MTRGDARERPIRFARAACMVASLLLALAAVLGGLLWGQTLPTFPPPADNQTLLLLRRVALAVLGATAVINLVWVARPQLLPVLGIGLHAVAVMVSVVSIALLRGEELAPLLVVPAAAAAVAGLSIVWAGLSPAAGPRPPAAMARP